MKQVVTVTLDLAEGQEPYKFMEQKNGDEYFALYHFFEDIGYAVSDYDSTVA